MRKYQFSGVFFSLMATVVLNVGFASNRAMAVERPLNRAGDDAELARTFNDGGRLIISRIPALGNELIVNVVIDGREFVSIGYGHTYETFLRPGRHVFQVRASPRPAYRDFWEMTLDVRRGETYRFTAVIGPGSQLILKKTGS